MRADARANHDRLVQVAGEAFAREGTGASLKAIAREAGVGIGTVYRRFPTREALVEAVYRQEVDRLCAVVPDLLAQRTGAEALHEWMERFVTFMAAKRGLGEMLRVVLTSEAEKLHTRDELRWALTTLLAAGAAEGSVRAGVDPYDLLMALGGITMIADAEDQRALASRLIDLLLTGVRADPATSARTAR
jgi:AcrR family transcriptional regulator